MIRQFTSIASIIIIFSCSCIRKDMSLNQTTIRTIKDIIQSRVDDYSEAMKNQDIVTMLSFWANSEDFTYAGDGKYMIGYDQYAENLKENMSGTKVVNHVHVTNPQIAVLAENAASYCFEFDWSIEKETGETINSKGSWIYVFQQKNGQWKVIHSAGTHIYY